jgi:hypothetical protein
MKTSHLLLILMTALTLASCGFRQVETSHLSSLPAVRPLIVGMSGYSTCTESDSYHNGNQGPLGAQLFRKIEPIFQQITDKLGIEPGLMASCFTNDSKLIAASSLDAWKLTKPTDKDYLASVHQQIDFFTHIFVVGHSYGGWLSMKLAETYNGAKDKIKTLHTIDPISKELCYFDNVSECLSAPRDLDAHARGRIRDNTEIWVNAWQDTTFFLHSSAIDEADENPKYEAEHWDIDNDDDLWETIAEKIGLSF